MEIRKTISTKAVVYTAIIAALYYVMVIGLAPLAFHALQFRAANVLKSLAVLHPAFGFGFAMGNFFANLSSPFGILDWGIMPFFDFASAYLAYRLRSKLWVAVLVQSLVIAVGVATFPLGIGGNLPWLVSFISVFVSTMIIIGTGTVVLLPLVKRNLNNHTIKELDKLRLD